MKIVEKFATNSFYLFLDYLGAFIISFAFWIIIWKSMDPAAAGRISTSIKYIIILSGFAVVGMATTLTKLIAEYSRKKSNREIKSLVNFSYKIILAISLILALGFIAFNFFSGIDLKLQLPEIIIITLGILIWPILTITNSILIGFQNMKRYFITNLASNSVKLLLTLLLVFIGIFSLQNLYIGPLIAFIVASFFMLIIRKDILTLGFRAKKLINKNYVIKKYALPAFFGTIGWLIFIHVPIIILTTFDSLHSSGIFSSVLSITQPLMVIPITLSAAFFPLVSSLMSSKNHLKLQSKIITLVVRYSALITFPLLIIYFFFAKGFILLFASLEYLEAIQYLWIVAITTVMIGFTWIFITTLFAVRKTEAFRNVQLFSALIFLILSIPFTIFSGITGLIYAYFLTGFLLLVISYFLMKNAIKFSLPRSSLLKISIASLIFILILLPSEIFNLKVMERLPLLIFGSLVYLIMLIKIKFFNLEDVQLLFYFQKKSPLLKNQLGFIARLIKNNSSRRN